MSEERVAHQPTFDLAALGITQDELLRRVVDRITNAVMAKEMSGEEEDGSEYSYASDSELREQLNAHVKEKIDGKVAELADRFVLPQVGDLIENFTLQATNSWGEKTGAKVTFIQYLVQRAEAYLREPVDYEGKPKGTDSYSWKARGTRIEVLIDKHLHYHISNAMQAALADANKSIAKGIEDGIKIKLAEILSGLKINAEVGR